MANVTHNSSYNAPINCNNNNGNNNNSNSSDTINTNTGGVRSLRDVNNFLQQPLKPVLNLKADSASYDHIVEMIRGLDLQDDGILMNRKIKVIEIDFCNIVLNEDILCESMQYMNDKALGDADTALKFAMLFSSRSFDALAMHDTKVRSTMLKILETNFINAQIYRSQDKNRLYNSITMLGEYYHRVRLADNKPVFILGESLLHLLNNELKEDQPVDLRLAKLLLSQITLNGRLMRSRYQALLSELFYHLRRQLIEQTTLTCTVKALLLMTLDMYYSNFDNLSKDLEDMYTKYFLQGEQEVDADVKTLTTPTNNKSNTEGKFTINQNTNGLNESPSEHINPYEPSTPPIMISTKKWSEQVVEESYENELGVIDDIDTWSNNIMDNNLSTGVNLNTEATATNADEQYKQSPIKETEQLNYKTTSPKKFNNSSHSSKKPTDVDDNKSLPRWRAPRFNREGTDNRPNHYHQQQTGGGGHNKPRSGGRRLSGNFDDDGHSVRSEGGSIRLYSLNDRLKHSQERIDRINPNVGGGSNHHNYYNSSSIANSNWDRQSNNFDDRSERSYISNYERGNHQQHNQHRRNGGGSRHFNNNNQNKQIYDKPPRFQKQQQQMQQQEHTGDGNAWRKNWKHGNNSPPVSIDNYSVNGDNDAQSLSSSRACTLPRSHKKHLQSGEGGGRRDGEGEQPHVLTATFNRRRNSQSPSGRGQFSMNRRQHNYRNYQNSNSNHNNNDNNSHNHNRRQYGSNNSLASDLSAGGQHHTHRRTRQFNNNSKTYNNNHKNINENDNNGMHVKDKNGNDHNNSNNGPQSLTDVDGELVRNARKTSNYMNYLSQKK